MRVQNSTVQVAEQITHSLRSDDEAIGIELVSQTNSENGISLVEIEQASLPPTDGGKAAYLFLCTCFIGEAMVWGE